ncbi:MAG: GIN domain-containing protein [Flavobacteriales bacterium]
MKQLLGIVMFLVLFACQKPADRACWKGAGNTTFRQVSFSSFEHLHLHANIEVELIQDSMNLIEWEAPENLMNFLVAEKVLDTLVLRNENHCHFLRYGNEKVKVKVHFKALKRILFENSEPVTMQGTWQQNVIEFILKEGAGPIQIDLNAHHAFVRNLYGWQDVQLTGSLSWLYADLDGTASIDATGLQITDSLLFSSASPKSSRVAADSILVKAQLHSIGNLYLKGWPSLILQNTYASGKIIIE